MLSFLSTLPIPPSLSQTHGLGFVAVVVPVALLLASLFLGSADLRPAEVWAALAVGPAATGDPAHTIVWSLRLPRAPRRVEVYDNSHIMGTNAVGAMIVCGPAGFMKQHYRTFNMRSEDLTPGDDYAMMREMLLRRFSRLAKEAPRGPTGDAPEPSEEVPDDAAFPAWPDLVLIDGGKSQLEAARAALAGRAG